MRMTRAAGLALTSLATVAGLTACSEDTGSAAAAPAPSAPSTSDEASGHDHTHVGGEALPPAGDGTSAYEIGYTLRDVRLPQRAGEPGRLSFVIENYRGRPQTGFLAELTKKMHVYVVRDDLSVFRHVHPEMRPDGTWVGNLTLPDPGRYRVVTEFMARDDGGDGDFVMLGARSVVRGKAQPTPAPSSDGTATGWGVEAGVLGEVTAGGDGELRIRLTTPDGSAPALGEYLGTTAHLTGFHTDTGGAVHMHPLGSPTTGDEGVELTFHTQLPEPGDHVLFLQVTVDGFLHTLPIEVSAG